MKQYFITRHPGAYKWALRRGFDVELVSHFDPKCVESGDIVIGTLPIHLAAEVCGRGGKYFHLILDLTSDDRGKELSADRMEELGARVVEYRVLEV